ncbi:MAG TPA: hypothetical protein VD906_01885 [Caulobacteraceae bacterium]|nr:hypothetical protein [Caulobacteraceae bacterium]
MRKIASLACLLAACSALSACVAAESPGGWPPGCCEVETRPIGLTPEGYAIIQMDPDTSFLNAEERQVVNVLIQAANVMTEIYEKQVAGDGPGHGFYPPGMTKAEFEAYLAAHPEQRAELTSGHTVVKRQGERLVAVPYSVEYAPELARAAAFLEQAAAITSNPSLKRFLTLRAQSFRTNDYFESEMAWMDLAGTPIEVAIGPYETYDDELLGQKTAFEAFVTLKDPAESAKLDVYKGLLRDMEANLPVEERYKNFRRGFESPIAVAEQVRGGGDNLDGPQTIAFNLPNDERVREAKGAKKVILSNVLGAKYEGILKPIAGIVLTPQDAALVSERHMTLFVLFHELSHSLGPGTITVNGRETTVDKALKEIHGTTEEAKADVMGVYNILYMMERGVVPSEERAELFATYFAGLFRSARWGEEEAHARGAILQYGYLKSKGAFTWDPALRRYRINEEAMAAGIRDLTAELVRLQGNGDYAGTVAFFEKYAHLDDEARSVLPLFKDIPVDIAPIYPERV